MCGAQTPLTTLRTRCATPTRWQSARHANRALSRRTKPTHLAALPARSHRRRLRRLRRPLQHHQVASLASASGTQSPWQTTLTLKLSKDPSAIPGKITTSVLSVSPVFRPSNACGFSLQQFYRLSPLYDCCSWLGKQIQSRGGNIHGLGEHWWHPRRAIAEYSDSADARTTRRGY